jgi:hypothetical protein
MTRLKATPVKQSDLYKDVVERVRDKITPSQLLKELNRVYREIGPEVMVLDNGVSKITLKGSFVWQDSPQGFDFWCKLYNHGY